ncbi:PE domain-containing protein [Nocardia sp. NPDC088792]|uniref:PE domain-containing protein n=1 Tax=Nocardia sp. NPDC088792 TaxID=3364332 RepID=UPI003807D00C
MSTNAFDGLRFDASTARDAASQLDALADRLASGLQVEQVKLDLTPAGADEVSVHAAQTLTAVAASFVSSGSDGVTELRTLAATLRNQFDTLGQVEDQSVLGFAV